VLCLAVRTPVEVEWLVPLARLWLFIPWFMIGMFENRNSDRWFNMRLGGATRGMWRIPDGKVREGSVVMFEAQKVVAPVCVDQGPMVGPR
jgi:hypothetical protein